MTADRRYPSPPNSGHYHVGRDESENLPERVRSTARIDQNGEVSWPVECAAEAVNALADAGFVVLGLDARSYGDDGSIHETPWPALPNEADDDIELGRSQAPAALDRPGLTRRLGSRDVGAGGRRNAVAVRSGATPCRWGIIPRCGNVPSAARPSPVECP